MSGWEKVVAATVLAVIGLVGLNLAIWRRVRLATVASHSIGEVQDEGQRSIQQGHLNIVEPTDHAVDVRAANRA